VTPESAGGPPDPATTRRRLGFASGADAVEEDARRLVGRVLRDKLAAEGTLEDGAAKRGPAALRALDCRAERIDRPEPLDDGALALMATS